MASSMGTLMDMVPQHTPQPAASSVSFQESFLCLTSVLNAWWGGWERTLSDTKALVTLDSSFCCYCSDGLTNLTAFVSESASLAFISPTKILFARPELWPLIFLSQELRKEIIREC